VTPGPRKAGGTVTRTRARAGDAASASEVPSDVRKRLWSVLALLALTLLLASCSSAGKPQDTFNPAGQPAQEQKDILVLVLWIALGVFILVEGGILLISCVVILVNIGVDLLYAVVNPRLRGSR